MIVGFIGTGNMGEALVKGIIKKKAFLPKGILVFDIAKDKATKLCKDTKVQAASSASDLAKKAQVIILAVKPDKIVSVLDGIKTNIKNKLIISIAAGVPLSVFLDRLGLDATVVRVMPNTPALVSDGVSGMAWTKACTDKDIAIAEKIFSSVGMCISLDEHLIDALTGLSGSGPAFCFMFIEALADGGVKAGLPRDIALKAAATTLRGSAQLVLETKTHPGKLKDMVASPSGTTIEGISVLEKRGFRAAVIDAVYAAYKRAKELGKDK
jgi:pyrroline-5-carboxylate reductase